MLRQDCTDKCILNADDPTLASGVCKAVAAHIFNSLSEQSSFLQCLPWKRGESQTHEARLRSQGMSDQKCHESTRRIGSMYPPQKLVGFSALQVCDHSICFHCEASVACGNRMLAFYLAGRQECQDLGHAPEKECERPCCRFEVTVLGVARLSKVQSVSRHLRPHVTPLAARFDTGHKITCFVRWTTSAEILMPDCKASMRLDILCLDVVPNMVTDLQSRIVRYITCTRSLHPGASFRPWCDLEARHQFGVAIDDLDSGRCQAKAKLANGCCLVKRRRGKKWFRHMLLHLIKVA